MKKLIYFFPVLAMVVAYSCSKDSTSSTTVDCTTVTAKFAANVSPILTGAKCTTSGCHPANGDLSGYTNAYSHKDHIQSYVVNRTGKPMPPDGSTQLTTSEKNIIACWIQNGAKND